jgi:serine phosphatase RsbU (regulator of sigma subunit)
MAFLRVVRTGQEIPIEGARAVMGRHPDCDIKLEDGSVSREHAQILLADGNYFIEDLRSRNGTFVNNRPITGRQPLLDSDEIKICDLEFTFHPGTESGRVTPAPQETQTGWALIEDEPGTGSSTIMSKLSLASIDTTARFAVRPEVKLKALVEITHSLGRALDLATVLPKTLDSLFNIFVQADRGFVALRDNDDSPLIPKAIKHRRGDGETVRISRTIVNQVLGRKEAILSADATSDGRFELSQSIADYRIRSMMCAPLIDSEGNALGVIQIDTVNQRSRFQQEDLDLLVSVAQQAALSIENARLHQTALEKNRIERDLELAHRVQQGFLPSHAPNVAGYQFFDFYEPAQQLGGDYYDYIQLPGGRLAIVLADVSGKGIAASLMMANLSAEVRFLLATEAVPADAINRLNDSFVRTGWEDRFVTLAVAVIDPVAHEMTLVNAGHMAPLWRHRGADVELLGDDITGIPLGVDAGFQYLQLTVPLRPGDQLVMFTDGFSEAMNINGELFGLHRVQEIVAERDLVNAEMLGQRLLEQVRQFVGRRSQSDDMCLTCFGRA